MNYQKIKQLAKDTGQRVTDLLALSYQNDPFYMDIPANRRDGEWFAKLWNEAGFSKPTHLRKFHYYLISQRTLPLMVNGKPYAHTEKCWDILSESSKAARWLGLVPFDEITDERNPDPYVYAEYDFIAGGGVVIPELHRPRVATSGFNISNFQPYHLEVWCEKSTMDNVLLPPCRDYAANLVTFKGEASIARVCNNFFERIADSKEKPVRIFYISDFDPAGNSMPKATARKIEFFVRNKYPDFDIRLKPIALTKEQIIKYQLPSVPIKDEKRAAKFRESFGMEATELDALEALHAGELARIVRSELAIYFDDDKANATLMAENEAIEFMAEPVREILAKYEQEIAALEEMQRELEEVSTDIEEFVPEVAEPAVEEDEDWLFDSKRDYLTQIAYYKKHKQGT